MPKSSLNFSQKLRIFQLSTEDNISQSKLASLYDVSQSTISSVLKDMRHEAEKAELKKSIENAMAKGVQASIEDGTLKRKPVLTIPKK